MWFVGKQIQINIDILGEICEVLKKYKYVVIIVVSRIGNCIIPAIKCLGIMISCKLLDRLE